MVPLPPLPAGIYYSLYAVYIKYMQSAYRVEAGVGAVSGEQIPLDIEPNATLIDVHDLMSRTYGVPPTTYSLSFGRVLIVADMPLTGQGVTAENRHAFSSRSSCGGAVAHINETRFKGEKGESGKERNRKTKNDVRKL